MAEILIVIVIIGIMAALAIPRFFGQTEKARTSEAINMLSSLRRAQLQYADANSGSFAVIGDYCNDPAEKQKFQDALGIAVPNCEDTCWSYQAMDSINSVAVATRKARGSETVPAGTLAISADGAWSGSGKFSGPDEPRGDYWPF
jgi:type II secretory pathway pseudopilin PulG